MKNRTAGGKMAFRVKRLAVGNRAHPNLGLFVCAWLLNACVYEVWGPAEAGTGGSGAGESWFHPGSASGASGENRETDGSMSADALLAERSSAEGGNDGPRWRDGSNPEMSDAGQDVSLGAGGAGERGGDLHGDAQGVVEAGIDMWDAENAGAESGAAGSGAIAPSDGGPHDAGSESGLLGGACEPSVTYTFPGDGGQQDVDLVKGSTCIAICGPIGGWGCSGMAGRSLTVNEEPVVCGKSIPPPLSDGCRYFLAAPYPGTANFYGQIYWYK